MATSSIQDTFTFGRLVAVLGVIALCGVAAFGSDYWKSHQAPAVTEASAPDAKATSADPYLVQRLTDMLDQSEKMYRSAYLMGAEKAADERDMFITKVAKLNYFGATFLDVPMEDEDDKYLSDDGMRQQRSNYRSGYAHTMNELLRGGTYRVQFLKCLTDHCEIRVYFLKRQ